MTSDKSTSSKVSIKTHSTSNMHYITNLLSFVAVYFCGIALFLAMILSKFGISASICSMMQKIANVIGWSVLCLYSFVRKKDLFFSLSVGFDSSLPRNQDGRG